MIGWKCTSQHHSLLILAHRRDQSIFPNETFGTDVYHGHGSLETTLVSNQGFTELQVDTDGDVWHTHRTLWFTVVSNILSSISRSTHNLRFSKTNTHRRKTQTSKHANKQYSIEQTTMARTASLTLSVLFVFLATMALLTDPVSAKAVDMVDVPNDSGAEIVSIEEVLDNNDDDDDEDEWDDDFEDDDDDDFEEDLGFEDEEADDPRFDAMFGRRLTRKRRTYKVTLRITNLSFLQPFSPFFVMVHNSRVRLYEFGGQASAALATLAEDGNPRPLRALFRDNKNVRTAKIHKIGAPYSGGETTSFTIKVTRNFPRITIAAMAINTNDLFVSLNGVIPYPGTVLFSDGLDAGSEENNELCSSIPGPACPEDSGNTSDGNGEGFIHVHRGFHGDFDLNDARYDWRNPMMRVEFKTPSK